MRTVKFLNDYKDYKKGQVVELANNEAWLLVDELKVASYDVGTPNKTPKKKKTKVMQAGRKKTYHTK